MNETHCCKLHANRRNNSQHRWAINVGSCCVRLQAEPLPRVFDMLQYFAFDLLNKMRYILWVVALLEACDVTNNGRHLGRHLGFY